MPFGAIGSGAVNDLAEPCAMLLCVPECRFYWYLANILLFLVLRHFSASSCGISQRMDKMVSLTEKSETEIEPLLVVIVLLSRKLSCLMQCLRVRKITSLSLGGSQAELQS